MRFKKFNSVLGWALGLLACTVYISTREASGSFWDCGEFISSAFRLQVPHPPGAPLFLLLGRLFIILFGDGMNALSPSPGAAGAMNLLSALSSGLTITFLFWTITRFARRLLLKTCPNPTRSQAIAILGAGVVGSLAFTFSDSFWFSAVEGEVYGLASLLTAIIFWVMLRWEEQADAPHADRLIILAAYLIGLSIGVHLLGLLVIPSGVLIYYFRRFRISRLGTLLALGTACLLTGLVQVVLIRFPVRMAGRLDRYFVNTLGWPLNSGALTFVLLLGLILIAGIWWTRHRRNYPLNLGLLCLGFLLLGFSPYITTLIRAQADPPINMNRPDNAVSLLGYLDRKSYSNWPILYGPYYDSRPSGYRVLGPEYEWGQNRYRFIGDRRVLTYPSSELHIFPRVWDRDDSRGQADDYRLWLGLGPDQHPGFWNNLAWFGGYQLGWMYFRYFLWNFCGRQNDIQGFGNVRDGNFISGIPLLDRWWVGDSRKLPESLRHNKGHIPLFGLPLLLGLLGIFVQLGGDRKGFLVNSLLFFFTGIAIVIYLNQTGGQARERDYSYVGSFYAFAIWIGLGVLGIFRLLSCWVSARAAAWMAGILCLLAVPLLMACQEWKDHDRSQKTLARDIGKDYLNSCAQGAILFTFGDNDTYPLWFAQEVEGIRPDVRIVNLSLLGADWYINEMRRATVASPGIPMTWKPGTFFGNRRNYIRFFPAAALNQDTFYELGSILDFLASDLPSDQVLDPRDQDTLNFLPVRNLYLPVNRVLILKNGTLPQSDSARILGRLEFRIGLSGLFKNDLALLDIVEANGWQRPLEFTGLFPGDRLGLNSFLEPEGMVYRLVPLAPGPGDSVDHHLSSAGALALYPVMMQDFGFGGAGIPGTYFDQTSRRALMDIRSAYAREALALTEEGYQDLALRILNHCDQAICLQNFPYGGTSQGNIQNLRSLQSVYAYYRSGDPGKADSLALQINSDCRQQIRYYRSLPAYLMTDDLRQDSLKSVQILRELATWKDYFAPGYALGSVSRRQVRREKLLVERVRGLPYKLQGLD